MTMKRVELRVEFVRGGGGPGFAAMYIACWEVMWQEVATPFWFWNSSTLWMRCDTCAVGKNMTKQGRLRVNLTKINIIYPTFWLNTGLRLKRVYQKLRPLWQAESLLLFERGHATIGKLLIQPCHLVRELPDKTHKRSEFFLRAFENCWVLGGPLAVPLWPFDLRASP